MNSIRKLSQLLFLVIIMAALSFGCKSNKKAMEASNAAKEKARIEQEAAARKQQEEEARRREAEEIARKAEEAKRLENEVRVITPRTKLNEYFVAISTSNNVTAANNTINEALSMFASPDAPVLIIISESGGAKDYDRPTTIKAYLNYLKDQKKNSNAISEMKMDLSGKISELELRKN